MWGSLRRGGVFSQLIACLCALLLIGLVQTGGATPAQAAGNQAGVSAQAVTSDISHARWAHHPGQLKEVMASGWRGNLDFAIGDVSATRKIREWGGETKPNDPSWGQWYNLSDIIKLINQQIPNGYPGTLYITGYHEVNGNWMRYGDACRAKSGPCQMPIKTWAAEEAKQYRTIKQGLRRNIKVVFLSGLNFGSTTKVGKDWVPTVPDAWLKEARLAGIPVQGIGVSMYEMTKSEIKDAGNFTAFKSATWPNGPACIKAKQPLKTCKLRAPLGPTSWEAVSKRWGLPLYWREWGARTIAWRDAAKRYLADAMRRRIIRDEIYLYDETRNAVHYIG